MTPVLELLRADFVRDALAAALMVALLCSFLGVFVVLKRIVFVGAALAEAASLGAALSFSPPVVALFAAVPLLHPLEHFRPLLLAMALMLLAVVFFSQRSFSRRLPQEALIGAVFAGAAGLTVLMLSKVPSADQHELDVLTGNILGVQAFEMTELAVASVLVGALQLLFHKEFVLISFDREVASTLGYRAARWELTWYLMLGVMIAVSIHVAGTVLVFAYLVMPPVVALLLSRKLRNVFLLSILVGVAATLAGVLLSVSPLDLPTSPAIVGCLALCVALAFVGRKLEALRSGAGGIQ